MNRQLLSDGLLRLGLEADEAKIGTLEAYLSEIAFWNPRYGLVRASGDELIVRHLLDSLAGVPVIAGLLASQAANGTESGAVSGAATGAGLSGSGDGGAAGVSGRIADIGSGAGFPGIPLAVYLSGCEVSLVESGGRRCAFLRNATAVLGLRNAAVRELRAETLAARVAENGEPGYDIVTFRAFSPLEEETLAMLLKLLSNRGWIVAYKGKRARILDELAPLEGLYRESRILPLEAPFLTEERHLVLLR